jgi:hypothetical protein
MKLQLFGAHIAISAKSVADYTSRLSRVGFFSLARPSDEEHPHHQEYTP